MLKKPRALLAGAPICLLAALLGSPDRARAQGQLICDWVGNATPGGTAGNSCLDLVKLESGDPIRVAGNTTRINKDSLRLCGSAFRVPTGGEADIVFIYDNSTSMTATHVHINTSVSPSESTFYFASGAAPNDCSSGDLAGTITYLTGDPRIGTRQVRQVRKPCAAFSRSGDPYYVRRAVMSRGVDYLAKVAPFSTVGAVGFGSTTSHLRPPMQLNQAANVNLVKGSFQLSPNYTSTDYTPPLEQAYAWFRNDSLMKTGKKAIIFISDGAPMDIGYLEILDTRIAVHSLFLGYPDFPYQSLQRISQLTGGKFNLIDPGDISRMDAVMADILNNIIVPRSPDSILITNKSLVPPQTSRATGANLVPNPDGSFSPRLDSILALRQGENTIEVGVFFRDTTRLFEFTLQADGPTAGGSTRQLACRTMPTLMMLNPRGTPDTGYPLTAAAYSVRLTRSSNDISTAVVAAESRDPTLPQPWGDRETLTLPLTGGANASFTYSLGAMDFLGGAANATPGNRLLEASLNGMVALNWVHPRDPREFAVYELPSGNEPRLELYHAGVRLNAVASEQSELEIRLFPGSGDACTVCLVLVQPSGSPDRETVTLSAAAGRHGGMFTRELDDAPAPGDGRLQHRVSDSIILIYRNPGNPRVMARASFPFIPPFPHSLEIKRFNEVARMDKVPAGTSNPWVMIAPPGTGIVPMPGSEACCRMEYPVTQETASGHVGVTISATGGFTAELQVFSNLGEIVSKVAFIVPQGEFGKLPAGPLDSSRVMTVLWGNRSSEGRPAGTGAYILRTTVLIPGENLIRSDTRRVGLIRSR